jgi:hypothetical protein
MTNLHREDGVALVVAMMALLLMSALGAALILTTSSETMIAGNFRNGSEALYAADAIVERVVDDLLTVSDWNGLLSESVRSALVDGPPGGTRRLADGSTIDLAEVASPPSNPMWRLYAYGPLSDMISTGTIDSPFYVVLMVSGPENAGADVLALRAEAFGPRGAHKTIEVTLTRTGSQELERGYTAQRGQNEQSRRARKAAVQKPGRPLTMQQLNLSDGGVHE